MAPAGAALPDGRVLVTGGFGYDPFPAFFYSNQTWLLDPTDEQPQWVSAAPFPWQRSGLTCVSVTKGVSCFGGGKTDPAYRDAALFDGTKWTAMAPMREARNWLGGASVVTDHGAEAIYAVGGYCCNRSTGCFFSPLASVERYDIRANTWAAAAALPSARGGGAALGRDALSVIAVGGDAQSTLLLGALGAVGSAPSELASSSESHFASAPVLHGLTLVANGPAKVALTRLDASTGTARVIGPAHSELFGPGDLVALAHGLLFYLGDTPRGATLVALNLTDGVEVCSAAVALEEIKFVGIGQSLDYDPASDTLVLSGLAAKPKATHAVYRAPATTCGPFEHVGTFGLAEWLPMLHASAFDGAGDRLFVTVGTSDSTQAIGVVSLKPGGNLTVVAEGPSAEHTLLSMHWDPKAGRLLGVVGVGSQLEIHALDPTPPGRWDPPRRITGVPPQWNTLGGNDATESAFHVASRALFLLAGRNDPQTGEPSYDLATIDVDQATVLRHPPLPPLGMPGCTTCLSALATAQAS